MKRTGREAIFFILVFLLFYLAVKFSGVLSKMGEMNSEVALVISGILFTLVIAIIFHSVKMSSEGFWDVSDYAKCKGGPYFWQGDSPTSKMCRELAKTPEGRIGISNYNCPTGFAGQPGSPFYYSPLSDDNWENERCEDRPPCKGVDVGLCSLEKQNP